MRRLRSRRRTPLCGTHLPHFELIDAPARIDYLLRSWPDPRLFRRVWSLPDWIETMPPRMDVANWSRGNVPWLQRLTLRRRRAGRPRPDQLTLAFEDEPSRVLSSGIEGFVASIPVSIVQTLDGFRLGQFPLLQLLAGHPTAQDVVADSPVLVMALTDLPSFRPGAAHEIRARTDALLRMRQRDALGWLGFPATNAARGILRRVPRPAVSVELLLRLRRVLHDDETARWLRHCPCVHTGVVGLVGEPGCRPFLTPGLLEDVADRTDELFEASTARRLETIVTLAAALDRKVGPFRSRATVEQAQAELARACDRRLVRPPAPVTSRAAPGPRPAPPPEFPAPDLALPPPSLGLSAKPIDGSIELKAWARRQHNCCASDYYARRLRRGTLKIYCLKLGPEEATLSLVRERLRWRRSELEGPSNTPCSPAMRQAVQRWLTVALGPGSR